MHGRLRVSLLSAVVHRSSTWGVITPPQNHLLNHSSFELCSNRRSSCRAGERAEEFFESMREVSGKKRKFCPLSSLDAFVQYEKDKSVLLHESLFHATSIISRMLAAQLHTWKTWVVACVYLFARNFCHSYFSAF